MDAGPAEIIKQLRREIEPLTQENQRLRAENEQLRGENKRLAEQLAEAQRIMGRQAAPFRRDETKKILP